MAQIVEDGITFDDVLLVPSYSQVIPNQVDLHTNLTKKKLIKGFRLYAAIVLCFALFGSVTAFAAGDPLSTINNLSTFIFGLIRAVGLIVLGWGIVQVGLSFQSHDPSQRSNGFLTLAGGVVITFAKEILDLII